MGVRKLFFFILVCNCAMWAQPLFAQNEQKVPTLEKVYVHTDRSLYTLGETLWYKAYLVYAYVHTPLDHSKLLYVELVSPEKEVVSRQIIRLEAGLGHGELVLHPDKGIKPGHYQLRAYTNWMRNFKDDFIFKKDISIADLNDGELMPPKSLTGAAVSTDTTAGKLDVQFFPEGGSLIDGVSSTVAFLATDANGAAVNISGKVFNDAGEMVSLFKTSHNGMGAFVLPKAKGNYKAQLQTEGGTSFEQNLPLVQQNGFALSVVRRSGQNRISIKTNASTLAAQGGKPVSLVCTMRGINYFEGSQALQTTETSFVLPEKDFPEGIAQLTLFDADGKPHSERLVYIEKPALGGISMQTNKSSYGPKEKVIVSLEAKGADGKAIPSVYSLAVVAAAAQQEGQSNISSHFLMESDIRGKVKNPGAYFDVNNPKRMHQMNLLLMTQGWRDFLWKTIPQEPARIAYKVEEGIMLYGRVQNALNKGSKDNYAINMALTSAVSGVNTQDAFATPDGFFRFGPLHFSGPASLMLNSKNRKGKPGGKLKIDSLYKAPAAIKPWQPIWDAGIKESSDAFVEQSVKNNFLFGVANENMLDEVTVTAAVEKKESAAKNAIFSPDFTRVLDDKTPSFSTMANLIRFSVPGVVVSQNSVRFARYNGPALILVDGYQVGTSGIDDYSPDDVARIETLTGPGAAVYGSNGGNGIIAIYTKEGKRNNLSPQKPHTLGARVMGYHNAKVFYAPKYDGGEQPKKPDLRTTLYWNPEVFPNEAGYLQLEFYNGELTHQVNVQLEGITQDGVPIVRKSTYAVSQ